jgi:diguanylate cyclase (GGDEF)-like protein/PAS domain S-box-containing protein
MRLLLVEDKRADAVLIQAMTRQLPGVAETVHVQRLADALRYLNGGGPCDLVLLDLGLTDSQGLDTLTQLLREEQHGFPVVVLTGLDDEENALAAIRHGAQDYLVKGRIDPQMLDRSIGYAKERHALQLALRESMAEVRRSEHRFKTMVNQSPDCMAVVSRQGEIRYANPTLEKHCRLGQTELAGFFASRPLTENRLSEVELAGADGAPVNLELHAVETVWENEPAFLVTVRDITARREAEARVRLAASVMESTLEGIFITDSELLIIEVNPAFTDITGMGLAEVKGKSPMILGTGHLEEDRYRKIRETVRTGGAWQGEVWNRHKDGEVYAAWLNVSAIQNSQGLDTGYVGIFTDITQRKLVEEHLKKMAHHDVLTGLPNRALFLDRLAQALLRARRQRDRVAVLFLDLDKFKPINDRMGHDAGDEILLEVAERLKSSVRESDTVARLGGDEFTIILNLIEKEENSVRVAEKVLAAMARPFYPKGMECRVGVSIGISIYPDHGLDHETLIRKADCAMYLAKETEGNTYRLYSGG